MSLDACHKQVYEHGALPFSVTCQAPEEKKCCFCAECEHREAGDFNLIRLVALFY